jgi:MFS family permease
MRMRGLAALRERPFRLLFMGQAASLLGDGMVSVALAFAVLGLTGSATDLGIVLAARTIPLVAFLLAGGVSADRLPRRALMVTTDLVRLAAHGAMAALLIAGEARGPG